MRPEKEITKMAGYVECLTWANPYCEALSLTLRILVVKIISALAKIFVCGSYVILEALKKGF